jgi:hypothetical protein
MKRFVMAALAAFLLAALAHPAQAKRHHRSVAAPSPVTEFCGGRYGRCYDAPSPVVTRRKAARHLSTAAKQTGGGYVTVPTAFNVNIEVAPGFAAPAAAVIADLAAAGFTTHKLKCRSFANSHVAGSLHFQSRACDVAQCGWGCTPAPKQTLRMIVARHGLRDGCEFTDAGHFDNGPHLPYSLVLRRCGKAYADAIEPNRRRQVAAGIEAPDIRDPPFYAATAGFKRHSAQRVAGATIVNPHAARTASR